MVTSVMNGRGRKSEGKHVQLQVHVNFHLALKLDFGNRALRLSLPKPVRAHNHGKERHWQRSTLPMIMGFGKISSLIYYDARVL